MGQRFRPRLIDDARSTARKADVLNANAGSTSAYSQKLNSLADRLHQDMDVLKTVQTNFGGTLQRELEAFAKRGAEVGHRKLDRKISTWLI